MKRIVAMLAAVTTVLAGCSLDSGTASAGEVNVVIGYQSKTINTVTAGALLRAKGFLEKRLADITKRTDVKYTVQWQDYDTGAPITAQMLAEKIDIGSMGDYPLLINGSKTQAGERAKTELVSVTGYNAKGALNMVVVNPNSPAKTLTDLRGQKVSASVGSAGHGTLVRALTKAGIDPTTGVEVLNQQPQVGASALESGQVAALAQFVAWPGLLAFQNKARLLFDGAELGVPTFHGVVARRDYASQHPEVLDAFLQAQLDATEFLHDNPLESAQLVAKGSGLPQEVVYLYNGPGGAVSFDTTLKPSLIDALKSDVTYLSRSVTSPTWTSTSSSSTPRCARPSPTATRTTTPPWPAPPTRRRSAVRTRSATSPSPTRHWPANCGSTDTTPPSPPPTRDACSKRFATRMPRARE
jgi:NitT/TauT family transport system substrate-binding protein